MSAAQTKSAIAVSGSLQTAELSSGFIYPLDSVLASNVQHVVINFDKDEKSIKINAINENKTVIIIVEYLESVVSQLQLDESYSLGIYELSEFVSMSKIFSGGFDFSINKNIVTIDNEGQQFTFLCSDPDAIKVGPKTLKAQVDWVSEFNWSKSDYSSFYQALGKLSQEYVIIEGKQGDKTLILKIADKDMASSAFKMVVDLEESNTKDFKIVLNKEYFKPIINSHQDNLSIQISERMISLSTKNEYSKIRYYVNPVAAN